MIYPPIIDSHAHCGIEDTSFAQTFENYLDHVSNSGIGGAVFFAPVMEIYDRFDPDFEDNSFWRQKRKNANKYLLELDSPEFPVFPYFFIWNDFAISQITRQHKGIKWHRHASEPRYRYDSPECRKAIDDIRQRNMPVVFEEEFANTLKFVEKTAPGIKIIIPHLGFLNGGYSRIDSRGIWALKNVYADTSLAPREEIMDYIRKQGTEKLLFGSDFPFGSPKEELEKILRLPIPEDQVEAVIGGNLKRLLSESNQHCRH